MKCNKCGNECEGKFCFECGARLPIANDKPKYKIDAVRLPYDFDMHTMDNIAKLNKSNMMMSIMLMHKLDFPAYKAKEIVAAYRSIKPYKQKASWKEQHQARIELGWIKPDRPLETFEKPNMINGMPVCPKCGSFEVYTEKLANADYRKNDLKNKILFSSTITYANASCITCTKCGHYWNV